MSERMIIVPADPERHAKPILALLNHAIVHTTWVYDYDARPESSMLDYFAAHDPILAAEDDDGTFLGFASCGAFRSYRGYLHSGEHSVYVTPEARGKGVGTALLTRLEDVCRAKGIHTLIGVIDAENAPSIALHRKCGYVHAGTLRDAGYKFGRWLSVVYYQKIL